MISEITRRYVEALGLWVFVLACVAAGGVLLVALSVGLNQLGLPVQQAGLISAGVTSVVAGAALVYGAYTFIDWGGSDPARSE